MLLILPLSQLLLVENSIICKDSEDKDVVVVVVEYNLYPIEIVSAKIEGGIEISPELKKDQIQAIEEIIENKEEEMFYG